MKTKVVFIREEVAKLEAAGLPRKLAAETVDNIYGFAYQKGHDEGREDGFSAGFEEGRDSRDDSDW